MIDSDGDPSQLLARLRAANKGGDVHLVGGPTTIETFRALGALDEIRLMVLPIFTGAGRRLTPELPTDTTLTLMDAHTWPAGVVELAYSVDSAAGTASQATTPSPEATRPSLEARPSP